VGEGGRADVRWRPDGGAVCLAIQHQHQVFWDENGNRMGTDLTDDIVLRFLGLADGSTSEVTLAKRPAEHRDDRDYHLPAGWSLWFAWDSDGQSVLYYLATKIERQGQHGLKVTEVGVYRCQASSGEVSQIGTYAPLGEDFGEAGLPSPPVNGRAFVLLREMTALPRDYTAHLYRLDLAPQLAFTRLASVTPPPPAQAEAGPGHAAANAARLSDLLHEARQAKQENRLDDAEAALRQALDLDPKSVDAHWVLAWVLAQRGDKKKAATEFEAVIRLATDEKMKQEATSALERLR
jgi:tetratricopeptide (TPR) repeat protein